MILLVQLIRNSVEISVIWHCAVECIVEHTYLRCIRHKFIYSTQALKVSCIVYWCQVAKTFYTILYRLVYYNALLEEVATLHNTMTYSINFVEALDSTELRVEKTLEYEVNAFLMVRHVVHNLLLLAVRQSYFYESFVKTDTLNTASSEHRVVVHVIELILDGRTSAV